MVPMTTPTVVRTYEVAGMTCEHCVRSIVEEVGAVDGVDEVVVSLHDGTAIVTGDVEEGAVRAAVEEAGYEVTGTR
jgi:copper chaperone CopZ